MAKVGREITSATLRYGQFSSPHEVYGVLAEEMAELLVEIEFNHHEEARREAIQIAAVAIRFASALTTREENGQI